MRIYRSILIVLLSCLFIIQTANADSSKWNVISAGGQNTCGIKTDGTAWCWGEGSFGQLGNGITPAAQTTPFEISTGEVSGSKWTVISVGISYVCGLRDNGTAWCWGKLQDEERGDSATELHSTPFAVDDNSISGSKWIDISAGAGFTCGLRNDGTAWCWGNNGSKLPPDTKPLTDMRKATLVSTDEVSGNAWDSISVNAGSICGLRNDGTIWCWQPGGFSLGDGIAISSKEKPAKIMENHLSGMKWTSISAGGSSGCGLRNNGTAWCWGHNGNGALGNADPDATSSAGPVEVSTNGVSGSEWTAVRTNDGSACGLRDDGTAWCWGRGFTGQLGNGTAPVAQIAPVAVIDKNLSGSKWTAVTMSGFHNCGLRDDGTAWCWGYGYDGELGDGLKAEKQATPVPVH